jgi:hypothetical protein
MDLDNDHDEDVLPRFRRTDNMLGPADVPRLANRELKDVLYVVSAKELASLTEPTGDPHWCKAMGEELKSIGENRTWRPSTSHQGGVQYASNGSTRQRRTKPGTSSGTRNGSS